MEVYEFEGKNTEDAIANACRRLNRAREDLEIEVLEPGSAGIFGLVGGRKAKIKVTIPVPAAEIPSEPEPEQEPESAVEPFSAEAPSAGAAAEVPEEAAEAPLPENENDLKVARETLEKILACIPLKDTSVAVEYSNGAILLNITGDTSGLLIGRKGRTLDALQFIVNKIVNKTLERRVQVVVDSENYRQRRRDSLIEMALRMGEKAKRLKKPVSTNPLNPYDRRIVHLTLRDDADLDTRSRGEGMLKKIVIMPKRSGGDHRSDRLH